MTGVPHLPSNRTEPAIGGRDKRGLRSTRLHDVNRSGAWLVSGAPVMMIIMMTTRRIRIEFGFDPDLVPSIEPVRHLLHEPVLRTWVTQFAEERYLLKPDARTDVEIDILFDDRPLPLMRLTGRRHDDWSLADQHLVEQWAASVGTMTWALRDDLLNLWGDVHSAICEGYDYANGHYDQEDPWKSEGPLGRAARPAVARVDLEFEAFTMWKRDDMAIDAYGRGDPDDWLMTDFVEDLGTEDDDTRPLGHGRFRPRPTREPWDWTHEPPTMEPGTTARDEEALNAYLVSEHLARNLAWEAHDDAIRTMLGLATSRCRAVVD